MNQTLAKKFEPDEKNIYSKSSTNSETISKTTASPDSLFDTFFNSVLEKKPKEATKLSNEQIDQIFGPAPVLSSSFTFGEDPFDPKQKTVQKNEIKDSPKIDQIVAMGFTQQQAIQSLKANSFDVSKAVNYLFESN